MGRNRKQYLINWPETIGKYSFIALIFFISTCFLSTNTCFASESTQINPITDEEIEAWLSDESEDKALAVSEGELRFLTKLPENPVHHIINTLILNEESLKSGWVKLNQCHEHLDPVPASEIVYRYRQIKNLTIESYSNIEKVWVEANSVQMENIEREARMCIRAEVRILQPSQEDGYILKNGPFHRKFLDGYYPMHITLIIQYPQELLLLESINPENQPGFKVNLVANRVSVDAWFEGKLSTETKFRRLPK